MVELDLGLSIDATKETLPPSAEGRLNPIYFDDVNADTIQSVKIISYL